MTSPLTGKTALELLKEAGYSDSDEDGVMEDSEGGELEMKLVTSSENESAEWRLR